MWANLEQKQQGESHSLTCGPILARLTLHLAYTYMSSVSNLGSFEAFFFLESDSIYLAL